MTYGERAEQNSGQTARGKKQNGFPVDELFEGINYARKRRAGDEKQQIYALCFELRHTERKHKVEHQHSAAAQPETARKSREKSRQYRSHLNTILIPAQSMNRANILPSIFVGIFGRINEPSTLPASPAGR